MDDLLGEMINTLQEARQAVHDECETYSQRSGWNLEDLTRIERAVRSLAEQADRLLNMMLERDPLNPKIVEVEDLLDFFQQTELRVGVLRAAIET